MSHNAYSNRDDDDVFDDVLTFEGWHERSGPGDGRKHEKRHNRHAHME